MVRHNLKILQHFLQDFINLTRDILLELKEISEVNHQNINTFVGACVENPEICIVTQYCNKGSLQVKLINFVIITEFSKLRCLIFDLRSN